MVMCQACGMENRESAPECARCGSGPETEPESSRVEEMPAGEPGPGLELGPDQTDLPGMATTPAASESHPDTQPASLWVKWVLANIIASFLAALPVVLVARALETDPVALSNSFPFRLWLAPVLGVGQWLVLRRWVPRLREWLIASMAGAFLYLIVDGIVWYLAPSGLSESWSGIVSNALLGAGIGAGQWVAFRRRFSEAGWWILACAAGWTLSGLLSQVSDCLAVLAVAIPGATTGIVLVWLVQKTPEAPEPAPRLMAEARLQRRACPRCGQQISARATVCRDCKEWLVNVPVSEHRDREGQGFPRRLLWDAALGALVAFPLPVAAVVSRIIACGPTHSSVVIFGLMALVVCIPGAALPAVLARQMGRRRPVGETGDAGDSSQHREVGGVLLGVLVSLGVSGCCALTIFFPECL